MALTEPTIHSVSQNALRNTEGDALQTLFFPPFPQRPKGVQVTSFEAFAAPGVRASTVGFVDSYGQATLSGCHEDGEPLGGVDKALERKIRQLQKAKLGVRLLREDCWKIGERGWTEPEGTSRSDYDQSIPPFTRLISATRDFLNSRHEEFQFNRSKRLMDSIRNAFGLRTEFKGEHVKGTGLHGVTYTPPSAMRRRDFEPSHLTLADGRDSDHEVCVLLTRPVTAVRGFLALARRDAEAGWDLAPALKLARITSAFISFLCHHQVISELQNEFAVAAELARDAVQQIIESKAFEDALLDGRGFNRALWTVYGGEWGGAERGGLEKEGEIRLPDEVQGSDGGWDVDIVIDNRPEHVPYDEALAALAPLEPASIKMLGYIPFSRRKVVAVRPPVDRLWTVTTVAAPWTQDEKWRHVQRIDDTDSDDETSSIAAADDLEKETPTIVEPETIDIHCDLGFIADPERLIGTGLRGRWALFGNGDKAWWAFKAKDYVLPSFWQSA